MSRRLPGLRHPPAHGPLSLPLLSLPLLALALLAPPLGLAGCQPEQLTELSPALAVDPELLDFGSVSAGTVSSLELSFVLSNAGEGTADLSALTLVADDGVFALDSAELSRAPGPLGPDQAWSFRVHAAPPGEGSYRDEILIEADNHEPLVVELVLDVGPAPRPDAEVEPDALSFGPTAIGRSETAEVTVRSVGTGPLTLSSLDLSGDAFFLAGDPSPATLAPGGDTVVTVGYAPDEPGPHLGTLSVYTDDPDLEDDPATPGLFLVTLEGVTPQDPDIEADPPALDFGPLPAGDANALTTQLRNVGAADLHLGVVRLTGPSVFSMLTDPSGLTLAPGESTPLTVRYDSDGAAHLGAALVLSDDPDENELDIPISSDFAAFPEIEVDPLLVDFGALLPGDSATAPVTVRNIGTSVLTVSDIRLEGDSGFGQTSLLPGPIAAGASTVVTVDVTATDTGARSATLHIESDDADEPEVVVDLLALSLGPPDIEVDPPALDFGPHALGVTADLPLTIRNVGGSDLNLGVINLTGAPTFAVGPDRSGVVLPAGGSIETFGYFTPDRIGADSATLSIPSNDPDEPLTVVPFSGEGTGEPDIQVTPLFIDMGAVPLLSSASQPIAVTNLGPGELVLTGTSLSGAPAWTVAPDPSGSRLPAGGSVVLSALYQPASAGRHNATWAVSSNDPDEPVVEVQLTGLPAEGPEEPCEDGYRAWFYNLPHDHPDVEGTITGVVTGDSPFAHDWWDARYFSYTLTHPGLTFGSGWWPVDDGLPGDPQYYAVRWEAWLVAATTGRYRFEMGSDDDSWAFIDGVMVADLGGIHGVAATTFEVDLDAGLHHLELYMAERHTSGAGFWFEWSTPGLSIQACP